MIDARRGAWLHAKKNYNILCAFSPMLMTPYDLQALEGLLQSVLEHISILRKLTDNIALLDMLSAFAGVVKNSEATYVKPKCTLDGPIAIVQGRHPLLELDEDTHYQPNDAYISDCSTFHILNGPNMSGKTTYLRQVAPHFSSFNSCSNMSKLLSWVKLIFISNQYLINWILSSIIRCYHIAKQIWLELQLLILLLCRLASRCCMWKLQFLCLWYEVMRSLTLMHLLSHLSRYSDLEILNIMNRLFQRVCSDCKHFDSSIRTTDSVPRSDMLIFLQVACIVIMAQIGMYVPAQFASICCRDYLATRLGSFDSIEANSSTMMSEMEVSFLTSQFL